jgi:hypothetical protein
MERSFSVEAKSFRLSAKIGSPNLRLEERRKGFVGFIFASVQCSEWLVETVESAIQARVKEEIAKTFREGDKAMMVHGGVNKAGRYLEVSFLAVGGRKGVIWLPEGRLGWGWRRFAGELRRLLEAQRLAVGSEEVGDLTAKVVSGSSSAPGIDPKVVSGSSSTPGIDPKRSYVQALCAIPAVEERATSLSILDLFPVSTCFESHSVGEGLRVAIDCAALEGGRPSLVEAAGFVRASETGVDEGVKKLLGRLEFKLDRILSGLPLRPIRRRRKKCKILGRDSVLEKETGPVGAEGPNPGLDPDLGLVSNPGPDPGCVLIEDLKPALFMGKPGDAPSFAANQEPTPPSPELSMVPSPDCTPVAAPSFAAYQEPSLPSPELSTVPSSISLDCTPVALPGFAASQEPSPRSLESDPPFMPEVVLNSPPAVLSLSPLTALGEIYGSVGKGSTSGELSPGSGASPASLSRRTGEVSPSSAVWRSSPVSSPIMSVSQLVMEEGPPKFDRNHPPVSSATQLRLGAAKLSDPRLASDPIILEAFTLPWEDDSPDSEGEDSDSGVADPDIELVSEVCSAKDVRDPPQDKTARIPSPALGLIKRGFLGPRAAHPAPVKGSDSEAVLGRGISQPSHVTSSVSKSQRGYAQRVKEKVAKQSNKNKELLAEMVVDVPVVGEEGYSKRVLEAMKCAPVVGMSWGGDDKKLLDTFSAMENKEPKVKGLRELKNLDCSMSPVKCQHRRGVGGSKNARSFPPEIH